MAGGICVSVIPAAVAHRAPEAVAVHLHSTKVGSGRTVHCLSQPGLESRHVDTEFITVISINVNILIQIIITYKDDGRDNDDAEDNSNTDDNNNDNHIKSK